MKKYIIAAGVGLLTTAAVTATVLGTTTGKETKKAKKECVKKAKCERMFRTACY
ncbi:MAG TPA: hypothetical protein VFZ78_13710 [Flavisolibacter sp.]